MPVKSQEPTLGPRDRPPKGYIFLPKGNIYLTTNGRRETQAAHRQVYTQLDASGKKVLGIHIPSQIYHDVMAAERASRVDRADAMRKRDAAAARTFEEAVRKQFPKVPEAAVQRIVPHAMVKGQRRVARTATLELEDRVRLAVWAHVRHCYTKYDALLRDNRMDRESARKVVRGVMNEILKAWGQKRPSTNTVKGRPVRRASIESATRTGRLFGVDRTGKNRRGDKKRKAMGLPTRGEKSLKKGRSKGGVDDGGHNGSDFVISDDDNNDDSDWTP